MTALILGLLIFLGAHSVRIVADGWRVGRIAKLGEMRWKGLYSLASLAGLALIVWGYGLTREIPMDLWIPPLWTRHITTLLTLPAFILLAAVYVPGNSFKTAIGHPMVAGVKLWALAHLISNGRLGDVVLFGAFLVWAALDYRSARRRDRAAGVQRAPGTSARNAVTIVVGVIAWAGFAAFLHAWLIGVKPFG
jgi:uncharacterized membrane protein